MSKFSNAKKVLSLVLGLMSSGTFGVSASRVKGRKPKAGVSRSSKGKDSEKNKKNNKKGASANKKIRGRALSADDIRMKKGKRARGNFFVDKDGKIKPLNTYGTIVGGGLLTLVGGYGLGKIGTVSKEDYDTLSGEKTAAESDFSKLQEKYKMIEKELGGEKLQEIIKNASAGKKKIVELVKEAWAKEKIEEKITKDKNKWGKKFASGRIAQNIKLAFPDYFNEEALRMNNSDFELYLLCRVVRDTLDGNKDKLVDYKLGDVCKISAGEGKSISFGVSPTNAYKFSWKIEGDYNEVENGIAREGTSGMSFPVKGAVDFDAFSKTFNSTRETILGGALDCKPEWAKGILAGNKDGVISADDCEKVQEFLKESKIANKSMFGKPGSYDYKHFVEWLKSSEKNPNDFLPKGFKKKYSVKTLKQAFSLMCILTNLRMFMSFVSAGAGEGNYYGKYSRSGVANALLSVAATQMDDATPNDAFTGPVGALAEYYIKSVAKGCKGRLPDYGIGQLLDPVD